jgi:hypothetical protein
MNEAFISIKVDREERPDLDEHFMDVSRLLTGTGGWPLTILLTNDARTFYAATCIPRENAYGRMGMLELVPRIRDLWENRREDVLRSAETIAAEIGKLGRHSGSGFGSEPGVVTTAAHSLAAAFDNTHGGFGGAPKFPMPTLGVETWKETAKEICAYSSSASTPGMRPRRPLPARSFSRPRILPRGRRSKWSWSEIRPQPTRGRCSHRCRRPGCRMPLSCCGPPPTPHPSPAWPRTPRRCGR